MSVINQMLKDLDERTPEQGALPASTTAVVQQKTPNKIIVIIVLALLFLNAIGLYIWSLSKENNALQQSLLKENNLIERQSKRENIETAQLPQYQKRAPINRAEIDEIPETLAVDKKLPDINNLKKREVHEVEKQLKQQAKITSLNSAQVEPNNVLPKQIIPEVIEKKPLKVEKIKSSMSVSRRQLTESELIEQKLVRAEKEISANNLKKAEALFEDILLIDPNQQQSRKKLAALWFGRKAFGDAISLLSQGIALAPSNSDFRLMQAHIYLQQGDLIRAYKALKPLESIVDKEYQLLIVNISQQLENHTAAINAYKILLDMQPSNSRWHLGLAIIYDQNSQFVLAVSEYEKALEQGLLTQDSGRFAQERIQALGVK
jgi:MSHA biogenesis protein MshN